MLSSAARTPGLPPSAAIAAVCTVGYFGFLIGPPAIGGLAELIGLPRALGLVVLLCALIAALGSRPPSERAGALAVGLSQSRAATAARHAGAGLKIFRQRAHAPGVEIALRRREHLDRLAEAAQLEAAERGLAASGQCARERGGDQQVTAELGAKASMRAARFTAGPITVKSSRRGAPILPKMTSPRCRTMPQSSRPGPPPRSTLSAIERSPQRPSAARGAGARRSRPPTGKIASMPSPMNFSMSPPSASTAGTSASKKAFSISIT